MKRTERQHLKENELQSLAREARERFEARRSESTMALGALLVIAVLGAGYYAWRERVQAKAHALLADAMVVQDARVGPTAAPGGPPDQGLRFNTDRERAQAALTKFKVV